MTCTTPSAAFNGSRGNFCVSLMDLPVVSSENQHVNSDFSGTYLDISGARPDIL